MKLLKRSSDHEKYFFMPAAVRKWITGVVDKALNNLKNLHEIGILKVSAYTTYFLYATQLFGRLFSPSDTSKKLSHNFLLHFWIDIGSYDHLSKYQGVFLDLL